MNPITLSNGNISNIDFSKVKPTHFTETLSEIQDTAKNQILNLKVRTDSCFENIKALDDFLRKTEDVMHLFAGLRSVMTDDKTMEEFSKCIKIADSNINLAYGDEELYQMILRSTEGMESQEDRYLRKTILKKFEEQGLHLSGSKKELFIEIKNKTQELSDRYYQNVIKSRGFKFHSEELQKVLELDTIDFSGKIADRVLRECENEDLRKSYYTAFRGKCVKGEFDNTKILREILVLRLKLANILGYPSYAHYRMQGRIFESPKQMLTLLRNKAKEIRPLALAEKSQLSGSVTWWNYEYKSWKFMNENEISLDSEDLYSVSEVLNLLSYLAQSLLGVTMTPVCWDLYHEDVQAYKLVKNDNVVGYIIFDIYERDTKRDGNWMTIIRETSAENVPIVSLVTKIGAKPDDLTNQEKIVSYEKLITILHEFGHCLHGLACETPYARLSSPFNTPLELAEVPSKLLEKIGVWRELLQESCINLPIKSNDSLKNKFPNIHALSQIQLSLFDLQLHSLESKDEIGKLNLEDFESSIASEISVFDEEYIPLKIADWINVFSNTYDSSYYIYRISDFVADSVFSRLDHKKVSLSEVIEDFYKSNASENFEEILSKYMSLYSVSGV